VLINNYDISKVVSIGIKLFGIFIRAAACIIAPLCDDGGRRHILEGILIFNVNEFSEPFVCSCFEDAILLQLSPSTRLPAWISAVF